MKNLSFREMSALGSALTVALMAYLYFPEALMLANSTLHGSLPNGNPYVMDKAGMMMRYAVGSVIALALLQIVYHIVIAILWRREAGERADERDRMVNLKAGRIAYLVMVAGLCTIVWILLAYNISSIVAAQYAYMVLFAGELIRYVAIFVYYRLSV
jgi:hypothetical protein